jgi:diacylglycerol kinase family enzyme
VLATRVTVNTRKRFVHVAADGEVVVMRPPLEYRVRPRALRVLVPRG